MAIHIFIDKILSTLKAGNIQDVDVLQTLLAPISRKALFIASRTNLKRALKWGIVSAGRIAHDFVCAVQTFPEEHHAILAVAARAQSSADTFAKDHGIPKSYEGYHKLATDHDLDIIYVANLNPQHYEVSKLMIEHGKHVLCEKPLTMNEKQTSELVKLARNKKVFLMEALWSRCFPAYKEMKWFIEHGAIGEVKFATVDFGHDLSTVPRLKKKEMGGGAILDLGVYILQFQQLIFRGVKRQKIVCNGHLNSDGTDDTAAAIITYEGGKTATVTTSSILKMPNEGVVVGTKGTIKLPDFWCPTKLILGDKVHQYDLPKTTAKFFHHNSAGLAYQAEEARQCINNRKKQSDYMPHKESIELARLMDTMRKQIGVVFPEDTQTFHK